MEGYYNFSDFKLKAMHHFYQCPDRLLLPMTEVMFTRVFIAGCCPACEAPLNTGYVPMAWPGSSLCRDCHKELIEDKFGDPLCLVCQDYLDQDKLQMQFDNHNDIRNHIHEGECLYRWVLIHLFARNDREVQNFIMQLYGVQSLYQPQQESSAWFYPIPEEKIHSYLPTHIRDEMNGTGNDIMDAEYREVHPKQIPAQSFQSNQTGEQSFLPKPMKALPRPKALLPNLMKYLTR